MDDVLFFAVISVIAFLFYLGLGAAAIECSPAAGSYEKWIRRAPYAVFGWIMHLFWPLVILTILVSTKGDLSED